MVRLILVFFAIFSFSANAYERSKEGDNQLIKMAMDELGYIPSDGAIITHEGKMVLVTFGVAPSVESGISDGLPPVITFDPTFSPPKVIDVYRGCC